MKNLFVFNLTIGLLFISNSFAQSQNFEDELFKLKNKPLTSSHSPTDIIREIEDLNDWYVNYRQEALKNLSKPERLERGREIAETIGLEVVRRKNTLLLNAHVLRLRQKVEQIESALESDNYPRLWMRQSDELVLEMSRNRLATIEQILGSTEHDSGALDVAITDLSVFISRYDIDSSHQNRTFIQTSSDSSSNRIRIKSTVMSSSNPYLPGILSSRLERDPELEERWMDYLDAREMRGEIEKLRISPSSSLERESRERLSEIINDFLDLENDRQTLQTLEQEAPLLEEALAAMYGVVSISFDQFVRENTTLLANLFELDGNYSTLTTIQRLIESPENADLKQKLESLHTEFIKMASLIPNMPENNRPLVSSCRRLQFTNVEINPNVIAFLETLNISPTDNIASANDLSFMFLEPTLQGDSLSCVAHAVASDMEFEINKTGLSQADIDEEYTYLKLQRSDYNSWDNPISSKVKDTLSQDNGTWKSHGYPDRSVFGQYFLDPVSFDPPWTPSEYYGVPAEIEPGDHQGETQEVIDRLRSKPRYAIGAYAYYDRGPVRDCSFIRLLIDNEQPPLVILSSNARKFSGEDWLHIPPLSTGISHVALVVGYGKGIDPRDMVEKPYFILRDSFVNQPIHYKVAADELLPHIRNIQKITQVVHLNPTSAL